MLLEVGCGGKGTLPRCWCGKVNWGNRCGEQYRGAIKILKKMLSSKPTAGHMSGEDSSWQRYMRPDVHSRSLHGSPDKEATPAFSDRELN